MAPTAHFLQREFCVYLDARHRVDPEDDRPDGVDPHATPTITVTCDADGPEAIFTATLLWEKIGRSYQCTTQNLTALLLAEGRKTIDPGLQIQFNGKPYVRRPLLAEQRRGLLLAGVLVRPKSGGRLNAYPLLAFPWHYEDEFVCIDQQGVEAAQIIFDEYMALCAGDC